MGDACLVLLRYLARRFLVTTPFPRVNPGFPIPTIAIAKPPASTFTKGPPFISQYHRDLAASRQTSLGDDMEEQAESSSAVERMLPVMYSELEWSSRDLVVHCLHVNLGMALRDAERVINRRPDLMTRGVHAIRDSIGFLTGHGVQLHDVVHDVDLLVLPLENLHRSREFILALPGAEFSTYYPLSRIPCDKKPAVFTRLVYDANSNIVRALSQVLQQPELATCRALSRTPSVLTSASNSKLLANARLLLDIGMPATDVIRSTTLLLSSPMRILTRQKQCQQRGIRLNANIMGIPNRKVDKVLSERERAADQSDDKAATVAQRLRWSRNEVLGRVSSRQYLLRRITCDRLNTIATIMEEEGYSNSDLISAFPEVYLQRPERLRGKLELSRTVGWRPPVYRLANDRGRFARAVSLWRRATSAHAEGELLHVGEERRTVTEGRVDGAAHSVPNLPAKT